MALAVTAVLLTAMGSAIVMTVSAADTGSDSAALANAASDGLAQINAEMTVATVTTTLTSNDILFTVPDRTGDGVPDTIEYTWSGTAGDPIMRSFNGSPPTPFIANVQSTALTMINRAPAVATESPEQVLMQCDLPTGSVPHTTQIDGDNPVDAAQYIRPAMPANASSWKITKVALVLGKQNSNKTLNIKVTTADSALKPTSTVLASTSISTNSLGASAWITFPLGPITGLAPGQGVCVVVAGGPGALVNLQYVQGSTTPYNTNYMINQNSPPAWSQQGDTKDARFILTGTITTMVEP